MITLRSRKIAALTLVLAIMISLVPQASYAKGNSGNDDRHEDKQERMEEREERNENKKENKNKNREDRYCFRAFGRLIAPGFLKKAEVDARLYENCFLPFGIMKKFRTRASSTPDIIAPVIRNVVAWVGTSTIHINWNTNEKADTKVYYSTHDNVDTNATTTQSVESSTTTKSHLITIPNLNSTTTYYMKAESKDSSGNKTTTSIFSATTLGL